MWKQKQEPWLRWAGPFIFQAKGLFGKAAMTRAAGCWSIWKTHESRSLTENFYEDWEVEGALGCTHSGNVGCNWSAIKIPQTFKMQMIWKMSYIGKNKHSHLATAWHFILENFRSCRKVTKAPVPIIRWKHCLLGLGREFHWFLTSTFLCFRNWWG